MLGGLESLISQTSERFSPAVTGEILRPFPSRLLQHHHFVSRLRVHIGKLCPIPASRHAAPSTFVFKDLANALHVFLWHGALRGALQAPYVGPYRVLHRGNKTYTIEIQSAAKIVSIDHLKPAYVLHVDTESTSPLAIPSSLTTRSRWRVCFPDYLGVQWSQQGGGVVGAMG